jgi:hypothetical protein
VRLHVVGFLLIEFSVCPTRRLDYLSPTDDAERFD